MTFQTYFYAHKHIAQKWDYIPFHNLIFQVIIKRLFFSTILDVEKLSQ